MGSCITRNNSKLIIINKETSDKIKESNLNRQKENDIPKDKDIKINKTNEKLKISNFSNKNNSKLKEIVIDNSLLVNSTKGPIDSSYKIKKLLGEGSYGKVYLAKHIISGQDRAMKLIEKRHTKNTNKIDKEIENEIQILKKLDHPSIVKIFEFFNSDLSYYLITEFCKEGELFDKITSEGPFNEEETAYIMYQLISAVFFCHSQNIIHRDLKPENILVVKQEKFNKKKFYRVRIIDFGTAKIFDKNKKESKTIGSSYYMAPEVINKNYNEKCDLWSLGIIMYILLSNIPPFYGKNDIEIMQNVKVGKYDLDCIELKHISIEAKKLLENLLEFDHRKRISAEVALEDEWFNKLKTADLLNFLDPSNVKKILNNLSKYQPNKIIKNIALAYLVHNNPQNIEIEQANKMFNKIDINKNGKITKDELMLCLVMNGISISDDENTNLVDRIFNVIDSDKNNYIEHEEFVRGSISKETFMKEDVIKMSFRFFDKDDNGEITFEEIRDLFNEKDKGNKIKNEMLKEIIEEVDENNDGKISYKEFLKMMRNVLD